VTVHAANQTRSIFIDQTESRRSTTSSFPLGTFEFAAGTNGAWLSPMKAPKVLSHRCPSRCTTTAEDGNLGAGAELTADWAARVARTLSWAGPKPVGHDQPRGLRRPVEKEPSPRALLFHTDGKPRHFAGSSRQ